MAGTIPLSMTQQFDVLGNPLSGGQLYIIQAGTVSTPQDAFQDTALTIKQPYPMTLDAAGRVPQFFLADPSSGGNATVKVRLQDKNGVVQLSSDNVLVIGPSGGTGGGGTAVDPSAIYQTGDIKPRYGIGVHPGVTPGWVRANGLTIGSATASPGATERGNADCQALFNYLWQVDTSLAVSGGRGSSSSADWTSNKTIALPDFRGMALSGLDGMGNSLAGKLTPAYYGAPNVDLLGAVGGGEQNTLTAAQVPAISSAGSVSVISANSYFRVQAGASIIAVSAGTGTSGILAVPQGNVTDVETVSSSGSFSANSNNTGGQAFRTIGPRKLCTIYIKL